MPEAPPLPDLAHPSAGVFSPQLCQAVLEQVAELGAVLALSVSSGREERVFFFTRGAILFLGSGPLGRDALEKRVVAKGLLSEEQIEPLARAAKSGDGPPLQDALVRLGIPKEEVARTIEEVLEEHLLQIALWDGALYDLNPGNPPPKLYDKGAPALRLSTGAKALLDRVRPRVQRAASALAVLGGSLKNLVLPSKTATRSSVEIEPEALAVRAMVAGEKKRIRDVVALAKQTGLDPADTVHHLATLVSGRHLAVEVDVVALTREQELAEAREIERLLDEFVNKLLGDMQLARIYTKVEDKEAAAKHYRAVADSHLAQDRREEGLQALREVVRQEPKDLEARELIVKVLQNANRAAEAAREAVELGRVFIAYGLPGRAKQAFELSLELVPGSKNALWMLGGLLQKLGFKDDAVRVFEDLAERSKADGDQSAAIATSQRIVMIQPDNPTATSLLSAVPGYARVKILRWTLLATAGLVLAASVGWGSFEMASLAAFRRTAETVARDLDAHRFDDARVAAREYETGWRLSRHASGAAQLLAQIEAEERALLVHATAREIHAARALEEKGQLPEALERWQHARGSSDPALARAAEEGCARCLERVASARKDLDEARYALARSAPQDAHAAIAHALERSPWLRTPALKVPLRIETVPKGAQATVDGQALADPTPLVLERPYAAGSLHLEIRNRDPVTIPLEALPPFPLRVVLPRHPAWTWSGVETTGPVLAAAGSVLALGRDRSVVALASADGSLRWRADLGLFGESSLPLARTDDVVFVRLDLGAVLALDLGSGRELWRQEAAPLPPDAPDPLAARPVPAPGGVLVREGERGLAFLDARTGARRWTVKLRADPAGPPLASSDRAFVVLESGLLPVRLQDGAQLPVVVLPGRVLSTPVVLDKDAVAIPVAPDAVVFLEGSRLRDPVHLTSGTFTSPLAADGTRVWAGTDRGEVLSCETASSNQVRFRVPDGRPVRWVRPVDGKLLLVGGDGSFAALDGRGQEVWRQPSREDWVAADTVRVYLGGSDVQALER